MSFAIMHSALSRDEMKRIMAGSGDTGCPATCAGTISCSSTNPKVGCECDANTRVCTQHNYA